MPLLVKCKFFFGPARAWLLLRFPFLYWFQYQVVEIAPLLCVIYTQAWKRLLLDWPTVILNQGLYSFLLSYDDDESFVTEEREEKRRRVKWAISHHVTGQRGTVWLTIKKGNGTDMQVMMMMWNAPSVFFFFLAGRWCLVQPENLEPPWRDEDEE